MIQKVVNSLKLDRPLRYYTFLYILVLALTYVNNALYYESVGYKEKKNIRNYIQDVNSYSALCMKFSNGDVDTCLHEVKEFSKNTSDYYGHRVVINGEKVIDSRKYGEKVIDNKIYPAERKENTEIGELSSINATIEVTRNSIPVIWKSVFRSATYSVEDIIKKYKKGDSWEKIWDFITSVVIWRSAPHLSFFTLMFAFSFLTRRSIIAQKELINELEELEAIELEELENEFDNKSNE